MKIVFNVECINENVIEKMILEEIHKQIKEYVASALENTVDNILDTDGDVYEKICDVVIENATSFIKDNEVQENIKKQVNEIVSNLYFQV